jgi:hypothetical protein
MKCQDALIGISRNPAITEIEGPVGHFNSYNIMLAMCFHNQLARQDLAFCDTIIFTCHICDKASEDTHTNTEKAPGVILGHSIPITFRAAR